MRTLTPALLRHHAGAKSYWRGLTYRDSVVDLVVRSRHVDATVVGADAYRVSLAWEDTHLAGSCSCPYGAQGFFCKHCVAVGLVLLDRGLTVPAPDAEDAELRARLGELEHAELVELLYERACADRALYDAVMRVRG
ncbi:SWIM zinc finger domain-containing protein [Saccharothrix longispora]|uniref:SWIM zinc finger family protein n=1 Tax=Saccharothrix longispora TaxID=33920 RepID=UPI0028FD15F6|nr:SWIM zinc finger family protein [Saccharothrix longispora]MBY8847372.1 SWIM zinc finger family protein [Saccharothrix sp. MB29]MDU0291492.1 SWIM zinc finger family protein [Saccharothrix longispora]